MDQGVVLFAFRELARTRVAPLCLLSPSEYNHWPGGASCEDDRPWECGHAAIGHAAPPRGAKIVQ
eukprot:2825511-Prymnesium_polylepis.1